MCCVSAIYVENKYLQTIDFTPAATGRFASTHPNTKIHKKASYTEAKCYHIRDEKDMIQTHHAGVTRCGGWGGAAWLIIVAYMFALLLLRFVMRYKSTSLWFLHTGGGLHTEERCREEDGWVKVSETPRCPGNVDHVLQQATEAAGTLCGQQQRLFRGQRSVVSLPGAASFYKCLCFVWCLTLTVDQL